MRSSSTNEGSTRNHSGISTTGRNNDDERTRLQSWVSLMSNRLNRLMTIMTYPFVVIFTIISLLMVIIFCIFPMLLCMTFAVCIYYCIMDDPIPLSVLLRYLLTPDPIDPETQPHTQSRSSIQAKLIIRKILRIEDVSECNGDDLRADAEKEYARRRHPLPIELQTCNKIIYFSEPIVYEEKGEKDDDSGRGDDGEGRISHYFRSDAGSNPTYNNPVSSSPSTAIRLGDDNSLQGLSEALANPPDDIEIGLVEVAIDAVGSFETEESEVKSTIDVQPTDGSRESQHASFPSLIVSNADATPNDHEELVADANQAEATKSDDDTKMKRSAAFLILPEPQPTSTVAEHVDEAAEKTGDYFGIAESRERGAACDICLLNFEIDEEIAWSPNGACTHSFHKDCILDWLVRKPSCPSCRQNYLEHPEGGAYNAT